MVCEKWCARPGIASEQAKSVIRTPGNFKQALAGRVMVVRRDLGTTELFPMLCQKTYSGSRLISAKIYNELFAQISSNRRIDLNTATPAIQLYPGICRGLRLLMGPDASQLSPIATSDMGQTAHRVMSASRQLYPPEGDIRSRHIL
jgi:hypothetical protein